MIATTHWSSSFLVLEVPVEAGERSVLLALVLEKQWALFNSELLQVPAIRIMDKFEVVCSDFHCGQEG